MTLLRSRKQQQATNKLFLTSVTAAVVFTVLSIFFYTTNVNLRYTLGNLDEEISALNTENAELTDVLYKKLDFNDLADRAAILGLIKEASPEYLLALQ